MEFLNQNGGVQTGHFGEVTPAKDPSTGLYCKYSPGKAFILVQSTLLKPEYEYNNTKPVKLESGGDSRYHAVPNHKPPTTHYRLRGPKRQEAITSLIQRISQYQYLNIVY